MGVLASGDVQVMNEEEVSSARRFVHRGYNRGSYDTVKRFVQPLREVAVQAERVLTRFGDPTGVGQGRVYFGQRAVVQHFFVLTLGYSRRGFYCAYPDEKLGCFLEAHERAFEHSGGSHPGAAV